MHARSTFRVDLTKMSEAAALDLCDRTIRNAFNNDYDYVELIWDPRTGMAIHLFGLSSTSSKLKSAILRRLRVGAWMRYAWNFRSVKHRTCSGRIYVRLRTETNHVRPASISLLRILRLSTPRWEVGAGQIDPKRLGQLLA